MEKAKRGRGRRIPFLRTGFFVAALFYGCVLFAGEPISYLSFPAPTLQNQTLYSQRVSGGYGGYQYKHTVRVFDLNMWDTHARYSEYFYMPPCEQARISSPLYDPNIRAEDCYEIAEMPSILYTHSLGGPQQHFLWEVHHNSSFFAQGGLLVYERYELPNRRCYNVTIYTPDAYRAESEWHEKTGDVVCADEEACTVAVETRCWTYPF